jgi:hypothetical protein
MHQAGAHYCPRCQDEGWITVEGATVPTVEPCGCEPITARQAAAFIAECEQVPSLRDIRLWERRSYR